MRDREVVSKIVQTRKVTHPRKRGEGGIRSIIEASTPGKGVENERVFWNIRWLEKSGRQQCIINLMEGNRVDFIGIQETKKKEFTSTYLESLVGGNNSVGIGFHPRGLHGHFDGS
jgi:hypothetical protein